MESFDKKEDLKEILKGPIVVFNKKLDFNIEGIFNESAIVKNSLGGVVLDIPVNMLKFVHDERMDFYYKRKEVASPVYLHNEMSLPSGLYIGFDESIGVYTYRGSSVLRFLKEDELDLIGTNKTQEIFQKRISIHSIKDLYDCDGFHSSVLR